MTRHTLRDLMIGLQGAMAACCFIGVVAGLRFSSVAFGALWAACYLVTPSRLPPRNERGQFSKRD